MKKPFQIFRFSFERINVQARERLGSRRTSSITSKRADQTTPKPSVFKTVFRDPNLALILGLGFSSGMPLLLVGSTLKIWLSREGVDIKTIGFFSWVTAFSSFRFLWAPLLDRFSLIDSFGRRRSWILLGQMGLSLSLLLLSFFDPKTQLWQLALIATVISLLSATQDVAIDAYRREVLPQNELALGSSLGVYGYRIANLVTGGVGISLVSEGPTQSWFNLSWHQLYLLMGILMGLCTLLTLVAKEPGLDPRWKNKSLAEAFVEPFSEFFKRPKALWILAFVFFFKLGDALAGAMLSPFYVQMGFSNADIGLVAKTFGMTSVMLGLFLGGWISLYLSPAKALLLTGLMQGFSTASFAIVPFLGPKLWALAITVGAEDISAGMGTAVFVAYLSSLTSKQYTATQYAALASIASLGRTVFSGFTGMMQEVLGWPLFFLCCSLIALPGLGLLWFVKDTNNTNIAKH